MPGKMLVVSAVFPARRGEEVETVKVILGWDGQFSVVFDKPTVD